MYPGGASAVLKVAVEHDALVADSRTRQRQAQITTHMHRAPPALEHGSPALLLRLVVYCTRCSTAAALPKNYHLYAHARTCRQASTPSKHFNSHKSHNLRFVL
jgi:hypothetical protein